MIIRKILLLALTIFFLASAHYGQSRILYRGFFPSTDTCSDNAQDIIIQSNQNNPNPNGTFNCVANAYSAVNLTLAGTGAVTSVFGRTGAVVSATNDYTFSQLASKPTTFAGYSLFDTSAHLSNALTDETGTGGVAVFNFGPSILNPTLTNPTITGTCTGCPSGSGILGSTYISGTNPATFTSYGTNGVATISNTESARQFVMPNVTCSHLYVNATSNGLGDGIITFVVRKNGVNTSVTTAQTAGGSAHVVSDTTNSVTFAGGDLFSLGFVNNNTVQDYSVTNLSWSIQCQ